MVSVGELFECVAVDAGVAVGSCGSGELVEFVGEGHGACGSVGDTRLRVV